MSFLISSKAELIKTRRSASFWVSLAGSAVIPVIFFLVYVLKPEKNYANYNQRPWDLHFAQGWQAFAAFLLPMFVILICSQIPQIEFKNNTWKQVFSSPQTIVNIFFSKFLAIILMILFLFLMFNVFMLLSGAVPNLFYPKYTFLHRSIDWSSLFRLNFKTLISLLGIIAIQYWFGLRFKNFIVPIGIGLALLITAMILSPWEHIDKVPYAFPFLTFTSSMKEGATNLSGPLLQNHEWNSIGYFLFFTLLAFLDMRYRKERG
jgi:hypothetical protein